MKKKEGGKGAGKCPKDFSVRFFSGHIVFSSILLANVEEYKLPVPPEQAQSRKNWAELREGRSDLEGK